MASKEPPIDRILAPLRAFTERSASGGVLLMLATLAALAWVNSPWATAYDDLWHTPLGFRVAEVNLAFDLHFLVTDVLMAVFFLVIGLEIKRELLIGELDSPRRAALPAVAAVGGAAVPAVIYLLLVGPTSPEARGWGVPMATDIAFALGALTLMGRWAPLGLRIFLTALAIVDDLLAVLVIAIFYTERLDLGALAAAGGLLLVLFGLNALGVRRLAAYAIPGVLLWFAVYQTGIHPTIAGVLTALTIPARTRLDGPSYVQRADAQLRELAAKFRTDTGIRERHAALWELEDITERAQAPMLRMEHELHPWVAFVIVPLFALANAGVRIPLDIGAALSQPLVIGVVVGLVFGKQLGITAAAWVLVRSGLASLPDGVDWWHMYGAAWLGGIGFTMSLFVSELAFPDPAMLAAAKLGILVASATACLGGFAVLVLAGRRRALPVPA